MTKCSKKTQNWNDKKLIANIYIYIFNKHQSLLAIFSLRLSYILLHCEGMPSAGMQYLVAKNTNLRIFVPNGLPKRLLHLRYLKQLQETPMHFAFRMIPAWFLRLSARVKPFEPSVILHHCPLAPTSAKAGISTPLWGPCHLSECLKRDEAR